MLLAELVPSSIEFADKEVPVNNKSQWSAVIGLMNRVIWQWWDSLDPEDKNHEVYTFRKWFIQYTFRIGDLEPVLLMIFGDRTHGFVE